MRMRLAAVLACIAPLVTAAGAQEAEVKGDLARLQGRWAGLMKVRNGGTIVTHLEFKGDRVLAWTGDVKGVDVPDGPGGKKTLEKAMTEARVILDESARPKRIQYVDGKMINADPNSLASKITPPDIKAVYELDGDTLKVASSPLSNAFPARVAAGPQTGLTLYVRGDVPPADVDVSGRPTGGGAKPKAATGDLAALQGTWTTGDGVFHGHGRETMTVRGDLVDVVGRASGGAELHFRARLVLNEKASPRAVEFVDVTNGNRRGQPSAGIYEVDGDVLRLHKAPPGKPRAARFDTPVEQGKAATFARGTIVLKGEPTAPGGSVGRAREVEFVGDKVEGREFQGVTVVSFSPRNTVFRVADGRTFEGSIFGAKGTDVDGSEKGRGDALLKPGNVVNVFIIPSPKSKTGIQEVLEFRLVRVGDGPPPAAISPKPTPAPAPAPAQPAERVADKEYRGAVIDDVTRKAVVLSVGGKKVSVAPTDKHTRAFDSNGRQLDMFTQSWVLVKGNVVDVVLEKAGTKKGALPAIIEIRLVEGKLKDVPRYLDAKPGAR